MTRFHFNMEKSNVKRNIDIMFAFEVFERWIFFFNLYNIICMYMYMYACIIIYIVVYYNGIFKAMKMSFWLINVLPSRLANTHTGRYLLAEYNGLYNNIIIFDVHREKKS